MDKLAMEEAGFKNCVSVPDGAPPKASNKALPSEEEVPSFISHVFNLPTSTFPSVFYPQNYLNFEALGGLSDW